MTTLHLLAPVLAQNLTGTIRVPYMRMCGFIRVFCMLQQAVCAALLCTAMLGLTADRSTPVAMGASFSLRMWIRAHGQVFQIAVNRMIRIMCFTYAPPFQIRRAHMQRIVPQPHTKATLPFASSSR